MPDPDRSEAECRAVFESLLSELGAAQLLGLLASVQTGTPAMASEAARILAEELASLRAVKAEQGK